MSSWPHAPAHHFEEAGTYIVTAATYRKERLFLGDCRLALLQDRLFRLALRYHWRLQAWAVFTNHYHFVAAITEEAPDLARFVSHLHTETATEINREDGVAGRRVWYQFWDTRLTYERSYLARLNYVHQNPVKHKLVLAAHLYPWCSARWFEAQASPAFFRRVSSLKTDRVKVPDDF
jgi:putative transposase